MITLASHKSFEKKVRDSQATAALFIYSDRRQADDHYKPAVSAIGKRNCEFIACQMNDVQPGRNRGNALPTVDAVMKMIKFFTANKGKEIVICDTRGKGLCIAAAIVCRYINHNAARKAVEEINHTQPKGVANGFVLRLVDSLLDSSLAAAAANFDKQKFVSFQPDAYAAELERAAAEERKAKQAAEKANLSAKAETKQPVAKADAVTDTPKTKKSTSDAKKR